MTRDGRFTNKVVIVIGAASASAAVLRSASPSRAAPCCLLTDRLWSARLRTRQWLPVDAVDRHDLHWEPGPGFVPNAGTDSQART